MKKGGTIGNALKRGLVGVWILMTAVAAFQNPAQAEMIRGVVVTVKEDGSSFGFKRREPSNPAIVEWFDMVVLPTTKFEKISSLKELRAGDEVVVNAERNKKEGTWEAHSVGISKVQLYK